MANSDETKRLIKLRIADIDQEIDQVNTELEPLQDSKARLNIRINDLQTRKQDLQNEKQKIQGDLN